MSAGTEATTDTRGYRGTNYVGNIVEKVLLARQLAENERKFASKKAEQAGTSLEEAGIEKGYFFKKALAGEFGGNYIDRKKGQLQNVVKKYKIAKRLTKDPKATFRFIKPLLQKKVASAQTKMFRAKFDYMYSDDINRPIPQSPKTGNSAKKIQKATAGRSKRVTKEELLSTLTGIVDSLNKTAESIGKTTAGISSGVISAAKAQVELVEQLKLRNTTLEDKLDRIALAIANQTQFQKRSVAKANTKKIEDRLEAIKDTANTEVPDDTQTAVNETQLSQLSQNITPTTNIINNPSIERPTGGYPSLSQMGKAGMQIPEAETGGIVSGPDSGYLAKLHGDEMVVPINNNYTQGEPSAMDGKVRPKPSSSSISKTGTPHSNLSRSNKGIKTSSLPSFERGTTGSSVGGRFGFGITNMTGIASGGSTQSSAMAQPLVDAMSLPMMATGGSILATVSKLMTSMGSEGTSIAPEIERITRPIADVFGLPPSIVKKTKQSMGSKTNSGLFGEADGEDDGESKKNIFAKMMDGFGALMEKLKDGVNNNSDNNNNNNNNDTGDGPGGSGQDFATLATVAALESGSSQGQADVAQSVYNRLGDTGQKYGKSISEILTRDGQYQVAFEDPNSSSGAGTKVADVFKNIKDEASGAKAIMYYYSKRGRKITEEQARKMYRSSGKAISDAKLRENAARHVGGRTEFRGYDTGRSEQVHRGGGSDNYYVSQYGSGTQMARGAQAAPSGLFNAPSPTNPSSTGELGQSITSNYGMKVDEERTFTHPDYGEIKARKTRKGFNFYKNNVILGMDPTKPQGKSIVDYFTSTNGGISTSTMGPQARISPPPGSDKNAQTQTIARNIDNTGGNANIIAMMMPQAQPKQMASTSQPSSAESTAALPGYNALAESGLYNSNLGMA